jgi:sugar phosphate isomerase/epimerase
MALHINQHPIGLAAYGIPWRCGFAGKGTERCCSEPLNAEGLLALAASHGLATVELPLAMLPDLRAETLARFGDRARDMGLGLVADGPVVNEAALAELIPAAAALGAKTLRVVISATLEGARTAIPGGWEAHLADTIAALKRLRPLAEQHDVIVAPENHQDATVDDLLRICEEVGGEHIGVTLDAVNPLAVGEEPILAARALGARIVNVHLKDYWPYPTESGYRLVRCALGEGVLDLPALFGVLAEHAPHATCNIELAALYARHIRLYEDQWWEGFPPRDASALAPTLRLVARHARPPGEEWRTPWEQGAGADALGAYEDEQVARSVRHLRGLG